MSASSRVSTGDAVLRELDPNAQWYPDTGAYEFGGDFGSIGFCPAISTRCGGIAGRWPIRSAPRAAPIRCN